MKMKSLGCKLLVFAAASLVTFSAIAETPSAAGIRCRLYRRAGNQVCGPVAKCDMTIKVKKDRRNRSIDQLSCANLTQSSTSRLVYSNKRAREVTLASLECTTKEVKEVGSYCDGPLALYGGETSVPQNKVWVRTHPASCIAPAIYPSLPQLTSEKEFSVTGGKVRIVEQLFGGCELRRPS